MIFIVASVALVAVLGLLVLWCVRQQDRQRMMIEQQFYELRQQVLGGYHHQMENQQQQSHAWHQWYDKIEHKLGDLEQRMQTQFRDHQHHQQNLLGSMMEKLGKFDESRKHLESLSQTVHQLNQVLTDNKTRGIFGEVQLRQLLVAVFGENSRLFQMPYSLSTGKIGDAVIFAPQPIGNIIVDSKFSLESFQRLLSGEENSSKQLSLLKQSLKTKINEIADKYIVPEETAEYAIMFIPAEGIFTFVHSHLGEIVEYGHQRKVWIASPTTLMALLGTIQSVVLQIQQSQDARLLQRELGYLANEFRLFGERMEKLERDWNHLQNDFRNLQITGKKITNSFERIQGLKGLEKGNEVNDE